MAFDTLMPPYGAGDPDARFLGSSCFDFLLIELVPMAYRVTNELEEAANNLAAALGTSDRGGGSAALGVGVGPGLVAGGGGVAQGDGAGRKKITGGGQNQPAGAATKRTMDEDEERDAVFFRLEMLGYRVGQGLVERFSRDRPRFNDTLDAIKFLCKDIWTLVFRKQVDNLKTNHRGVYVLTDNSFRPFSRVSTEAGGGAVVRAQPFLWFPCGIVRGALAAMGINASVQAESNELPAAVFQIKTIPKS